MSDLMNTEQGHEIRNGPEYIPQPMLILEPLVISEIVREIMQFIQPKDLSKYRLVCRTWNEEIIRQIKDRFTFSIDSAQKIDDFLETGQIFFGFKNLKLKCMVMDISECERLIIPSHWKLLRRLHLEHGPFDYRLGSTKTVLEPFRDQTQEFYTQLFRMTPNLKELHLTSTDEQSWRYTTSIHNCVGALMSFNPPNLKGLYFHCRILVPLAQELSTRLTSHIQKLVFDDLSYGFAINFDSTSLTGKRIQITLKGKNKNNVFVSHFLNYLDNKVEAECETGVSCTQLLEAFLSLQQVQEIFKKQGSYVN